MSKKEKENIKCQNNPNLTENLAKDRNKLSNSNSSVSSAKTSPQTNQQIEEGNFKTKEELKVFLEQNYPQFFENFELSEYIASGSSGNVFKGIYKQNKKQVAIKVLKNRYNKEKKDKEKILSRIKQEMDISSKLHNINIINKLNKAKYLFLIKNV